jgi:hypothetical protein
MVSLFPLSAFIYLKIVGQSPSSVFIIGLFGKVELISGNEFAIHKNRSIQVRISLETA